MNIRKATREDLSRVAEIFVENGEKELEEGTTEYLFKLVREKK